MFHLSPVLYTAIVVEWLGEDGPQPATRDIMIRINRDRMATQTIRPAEHRDIPVPPNPFTVPNSFMTEHLFVFLTVMLSSILIRLLGSKQQMKLEYEQLKTEKLQNSYNALMGQINPHFFFNSLNGLNALIQSGEKQQTLAYLDELHREHQPEHPASDGKHCGVPDPSRDVVHGDISCGREHLREVRADDALVADAREHRHLVGEHPIARIPQKPGEPCVHVVGDARVGGRRRDEHERREEQGGGERDAEAPV